jgi:hypothetical protein
LPFTIKSVEVATAESDDEATTKSGEIVVAVDVPTESVAHGVEVPIPTL